MNKKQGHLRKTTVILKTSLHTTDVLKELNEAHYFLLAGVFFINPEGIYIYSVSSPLSPSDEAPLLLLSVGATVEKAMQKVLLLIQNKLRQLF